jgi:hypothetical protein
MTPDERTLLTGFLNDLAQARAGQKDPEAEALIKNALSANPDGAYLLAQHAILSDQALHAARAQIQQLQAQLQASQPQPSQGTSFFGGARPSTAVPPTGGYGAAPQQPQQPPQPDPQYGPYGGPPPQPQPFSQGGGLGSFLRSAGTMAAGVAGGEFLFSGLSGLFGGHRGFGGGGFGGFGGGGFGGAPVENVTINEYNDSGDNGGDWDDGGDGGDDFSDDF